MRRYQDSISSAINGLPVYQAQIRVLKADGSAANLYSDNGLTSLAQPVLTNGLGEYFFYIADGTYTLRVANPDGTNSIDFPNIEMYEDARNVSVPAGEGGLTIPSSVSRANTLLGFDAGGLPIAVAAAASDLATIASIAPQIVTVANNVTPIGIVATDLTGANRIGTVATNIANVNAVGVSITNVNSVAGALTNINTVAGNLTNINTVATNIANVNATAGSIANVNVVANDMALGAGASFILRAPQAAIDAAASATTAAGYATAFGGAFGPRVATYGFSTPIIPIGSAWPNNSVIWAMTFPENTEISELWTQIGSLGTGGTITAVIATGDLTQTTPVMTKISSFLLTTPTVVGLQKWKKANSDWTGSMTAPAGSHLLFSVATNGPGLIQDTTLTGFTRYAALSGDFSGTTRTLTKNANIAIRARAYGTATTLQVPTSGLVDSAVITSAEVAAPATTIMVTNTLPKKFGSTLGEEGAGVFGSNQICTIGQADQDGPVSELQVHCQSLGSGVFDLLVLRGTGPDFDIVQTVANLPLTYTIKYPNIFSAAALGVAVPMLAGDYLALRSASGGPGFYQNPVPGGTFWYGAASTLATGSGRLVGAQVTNFLIKAQFSNLPATFINSKRNLGPELQGLAELAAPGTPLEFDGKAVGGQSNGSPNTDSTNTETVPAGRAYILAGAELIPYLGDEATFMATCSGTTMTITQMISGKVNTGRNIGGAGLLAGANVQALLTSTGGLGTIQISQSITIASPILIKQNVGASFMPAYVNDYFAATKRGVVLINASVPGSGLDVNAAPGNWSPTGALRAQFVAAVAAAKSSAATLGLAYRLSSAVFIGPAETDADGIDNGTTAISGGVMTGAKHETAWAKLRAYILTNIAPTSAGFNVTTTSGSPNLTGVAGTLRPGQPIAAAGVPEGAYILSVNTGSGTAVMSDNATASATVTCIPGSAHFPIVLSRVGYKSTGDSAGYVAIRAAQENIVRTFPNMFLGYVGAINWTPRGQIQSLYHGTVIADGDMGRSLAKTDAYVSAGRVG